MGVAAGLESDRTAERTGKMTPVVTCGGAS
jgi:hypothetical protein